MRLDPNQLREAAGRPARQHSEWEWNVLAALGTGSRSIKRVSETGHLREVARIFQHFCGYSGMFTPANSRFLFRNQEAFQLLKDQCEQKFRSLVFIFLYIFGCSTLWLSSLFLTGGQHNIALA